MRPSVTAAREAKRFANNALTVGAVYDRPFFPRFNEIRAVIDRPYTCELRI